MSRLNISLEDLRHAYVIESRLSEGVDMVSASLADIGIHRQGNPDFHQYDHDVFLIDHAHALRNEQSFRGSEGAPKIFIVTFNTISHEAQNALLKTLEEPTEGTHFFFITKTAEALLPTVRSRVQVIRAETDDTTPHNKWDTSAKDFLRGGFPERMEIITPITKAKAEERSRAKEDARSFLVSLERALYSRLRAGEAAQDALSYVLEAQRALSERSPSLKLLLEHIALLTPRS